MMPALRRLVLIRASAALAVGALSSIAHAGQGQGCSIQGQPPVVGFNKPDGSGPLGANVLLDTGRTIGAELASDPKPHGRAHRRNSCFGNTALTLGPAGLDCWYPTCLVSPPEDPCSYGAAQDGVKFGGCSMVPGPNPVRFELGVNKRIAVGYQANVFVGLVQLQNSPKSVAGSQAQGPFGPSNDCVTFVENIPQGVNQYFVEAVISNDWGSTVQASGETENYLITIALNDFLSLYSEDGSVLIDTCDPHN